MAPPGPAPPRAGLRPLAVRSVAALCVLVAGFVSVPAEEPTFYEKLAYGQTVLIGSCISDGRRAEIHVEEVMKGTLDLDVIRVAYRSTNASRSTEDKRLEFEPGERSILVVKRYRDGWGRERHERRYVLVKGVHGKIELPAEGAEALIEAARRLVAIQAEPDQMRLWDSHRALLKESNPHLVTAGFEEILKFRLGDGGMLPVLLDYLNHPRDTFRIRALEVLEQIIESHRVRGERLRDEGLVMRDILASARGDSSPEVRSQAIQAMRLSDRTDVEAILRQMARTDPSQIVRYRAEVVLLERSSGPSAGLPPFPGSPASLDAPGR